MTTPDSSRTPSYPLAMNTLGAEEIGAAKAVLDSGYLTMGEQVSNFESAFADFVGTDHALMVNSGSSANLIMVDAALRRSRGTAPLQPGDEVLVPALAWPTTAWPIAQLGLVPVFVDIDPETLALDLESAARGLSSRTKGMALIHVLGRVPEMQPYLDFCRSNDLVLLEDSCETVGAYSDGRHAGTFGPMGTFSCYFSHHLSTIEGGLVVTDDAALADDLKSLRSHGWSRDRSDRRQWQQASPEIDDRFLFVMGGYNVRPTEIQGAIGLVQLARLPQAIDAREALARRVADLIADSVPWLELIGADQLERSPNMPRSHSWMTLPFRVHADAPLSSREVTGRLEGAGVATRPIIAGNLARHPAAAQFETRIGSALDEADNLLRAGFMIGCHPGAEADSLQVLEDALLGLAGA